MKLTIQTPSSTSLYGLGEIIINRQSGAAADLPPADTKRWSARRKAAVVSAVRDGRISLEGACRRYELSAEEFLAWQRAIETYGVGALRVTRLQIYRDTPRLVNPRS
jgi:transposase-like protein